MNNHLRKPLNLDSELEEFLAAEDRLELKRQRAVDEQLSRDREFTNGTLAWMAWGAVLIGLALSFIWWVAGL